MSMSNPMKESNSTKLFRKLINSEEFRKYHQEQSLIRDIAVQIETLRQAKKLTQTKLATMMEVDQAVVSRMTNGSNLTLKTLEKFCLATNSTIMIVPDV